jgi:hypothetical protein
MTVTEDRNEWYAVGGRCEVACYVLGNSSGEVKLLYLHLDHTDAEIAALTRAGFSRRIGVIGIHGTALEAVCAPEGRTAIQRAMTQFVLEVLLNRLDFLRETEERETQELSRLFKLPDTRAN